MGARGYAVITGASSGIGRAFAEALHAEGFPLVLCARRAERLREMADRCGPDTVAVCADLSASGGCEALLDALRSLTAKGRSIGIFINCAGFGLAGAFRDTDTERELNMIDLNVKALHFLMKEVLGIFRLQGEGTLLNVASSAGLFPGGPYLATYYATKAYVCSLTGAVAEELREEGSRIYVACLCPGPVDTEFNEVAGTAFSLKGITPDACVAYCLRQMKRKKTVIIPGLSIRAAVFFARFVPRRLLMPVIARQQKKKLGR